MPEPVETNLPDVLRQIQRALDGKRAGLLQGVADAFRRDGIRWESAMVASISGPLVLEGRKGAGERLATRKGSSGLRGSFFHRVTGSNLTNLQIRKGSTSRYAGVHELGTVGAGGSLPDIVPKRARALTIPLAAAMTASGVAREPSARHWPDTFLLYPARPTPGTIGWIVQDKGGGEFVWLYRLASRVSIPPRLGMRRTHEEQGDARSRDILRSIREALAIRR